jgi:small subunit ribosomal protein S20
MRHAGRRFPSPKRGGVLIFRCIGNLLLGSVLLAVSLLLEENAHLPNTLHQPQRHAMPRHQSAEKRMRQNEKRRKRNQSHKSRVRTKVKDLKSTDDKETARELLNDVKGELDRLAAKGIIHKNKAANRKSKLEKYVNGLDG